MQNQSQKIIDLLNEIIPFLDLVEEDNFTNRYADLLRHFLKKLKAPHDISEIAGEIKKHYGGMGTFSDVVIYQNGKVIKEHDIFDIKRTELYIACCEV